MIIISENYEAEKDHYGWKLHSYHVPTGHNAKKERRCVTTFHNSFQHIGEKIADDLVGRTAGDLSAVLAQLKTITKEITKHEKS